ncbi:hypothetical protein AN477_23230 [Alicyclobacillus ferrooxydans]|uniref:Uncharacterized protein n=1 Tax=Alicyclobacillus ferrooxydans TaxID=471514 RepID=A0A0P9CQH9_9BACL|nr:hypothetical protein AN477_23230 [Alicyclobacillus ferrooxydans]
MVNATYGRVDADCSTGEQNSAYRLAFQLSYIPFGVTASLSGHKPEMVRFFNTLNMYTHMGY